MSEAAEQLPYDERDVSRNLAAAVWEGVAALPDDEAKDLTSVILDPDLEVDVKLVADPPDHFTIWINGRRVVRKHKLAMMKPARPWAN